MNKYHKEILNMLTEHRKVCEENNWTEEQKKTRAIYYAFRLENLIFTNSIKP